MTTGDKVYFTGDGDTREGWVILRAFFPTHARIELPNGVYRNCGWEQLLENKPTTQDDEKRVNS